MRRLTAPERTVIGLALLDQLDAVWRSDLRWSLITVISRLRHEGVIVRTLISHRVYLTDWGRKLLAETHAVEDRRNAIWAKHQLALMNVNQEVPGVWLKINPYGMRIRAEYWDEDF